MLLKNKVLKLLENAKVAYRKLGQVSTEKKNKALLWMAETLVKNSRYILLNNARDISLAKKKGLSKALIDRLTLTDKRIKEMAESLKSVAGLRDPVGETIRDRKSVV